MARHPHPVVTVILAALVAEDANVQVTRVDTRGLDVDLTLRSRDGRRIVVNIREEQP
ncbi:hypothetical protein [Dactylosporangium sp. CA-139066]|uniref:hypothetical protein n=1 Tax=Dactylosporangium sp. CA-139066 TaxID=3239930 RepID=UPI003D9455C9